MRPWTSLALLLAAPAAAQDLAFPVACTPGEDCYFQNLFDHDGGPSARDAACGPLAYDGHDGTDVALPTLADQAGGVEVLAAAPGVVLGLRDGEEDRLQGAPDSPDVTGRECGNGVLIGHADGWETQYCHLARGSVAVAEGQAVEAGDVLGRIGLSGNTEFPHLHLTLRRDGAPVDPFAPEGAPACGARGAAPPATDAPATGALWAEPVPFPEGGLTDAGFATAVPSYDAVRAGAADEPLRADAPLVLFALLYGGRAGDEVRLRVEGPGGAAIDHAEALERTQALLFRAAGLRAPEGGWPAGEYRGTATLLRGGATVDSLEVSAELAP